MLPTFIVIGAAKAGTTSMCDLLSEHPDVFVTRPKEPHYFSQVTRFRERRAWYESLFDGAAAYAARGEGSTSYSHPNRIHFVVPRIHREIPECRLIYMVRHPVRRLESDWKMRRLERRTPTPIGSAVDRDVTLLTFGLYWKHLSVYRDLYDDDQILIVFLEDLARDPKTVLSDVYRHIGVDSEFIPSSLRQPSNTASERTEAEAVGRLVRRVPWAMGFGKRLPRGVRVAARRMAPLLSRLEDPVVNWTPEQLQEVVGLLRQDSEQLLKHCGKDLSFWDLTMPTSALRSY